MNNALLPILAEILRESLAIIQQRRSSERVYVPHMQQWGTVRQIYGDGKLIGVMLDSGIFMQTSHAFTLSVEAPIYKEESDKFPLTNTSSLHLSEPSPIKQLTLF